MRTRSTTIGVVLGVSTVLALFTGCNKQPVNTPHSGGGASGQTVVHLAYFPNVTHAVGLVGASNGEFAKALGPDVKLVEQSFATGPAEVEALFAGQVDIGYIGPGPAINGFAKSHGSALKIVAGASSGGAALVARSDSGITDVKSLANKRVAVPQTGGTQDISLRFALKSAGLNSTDRGGNVSVVPVSPADTLTLFQKKELDAAWIAEPWVSRIIREASAKQVFDESDLWPSHKFSTTVVIVRDEFYKAHPDIVARFLEAHVQTVLWIGSHKADAAKIVGDKIKILTGKGLPADLLRSSFERTQFTFDPLRDTVLTFADRAYQLGYLKSGRESLGDLFDLKPLNQALVKAGQPAL